MARVDSPQARTTRIEGQLLTSVALLMATGMTRDEIIAMIDDEIRAWDEEVEGERNGNDG